jgi:fatty acid desaturase
MDVVSEHCHPGTAHSHVKARHRTLQRVLESYGVLTYDSLRELAHTDRWETPFSVVLERAIETGHVWRLSGDLYEAG